MAGWSVPGVVHLKQVREDPMGRRVLARHRVTRRSLAITYLSPELLADPEFRSRFGADCARLARVRAAWIARVHRYVECDRGVDQHCAAVVADHIGGSSLRALLLAQGAVGTAAAFVVLKETLLGLAACHQAGLAHGDLKPEDVILTPAGRIRLVDFGLWTSEGRRMLARSTPFYLAPEQWSGPGVSQAGDIYAATVTFFECLAGAPPFYAEEVAELSAKHARGVPPVEVLPEPVREIVLRGLAKDPGSRPDARALFALVGEVASRTVGPDWERRGRQELVALIANRPAVPELRTVQRQTGQSAWGFGKPVRLAAVMGGALALAAGLSSPPLAVLPGISIFGAGVMPPVLAFPDFDRGGLAVRMTTSGPSVDRAPAIAAIKVRNAAPQSPALPVSAPRVGAAPYEPAAEKLDQDTARTYGGGSNQRAANQSGPGQPFPGLPLCTEVDDHTPCTTANPAQPGSTGSSAEPSPASLPVSLPVPLSVPVPVKAPVQPPESVRPPVKVPQPIVNRDKIRHQKDLHLPNDFRAQLDSPRPKKTAQGDRVQWDRSDFTGRSVEGSTSRSGRGHEHFTSNRNSGNR